MKPIPVLLLDLGMSLRGGQRQVLYLARYLSHLGTEQNAIIYNPIIVCPKSSGLAHASQEEHLNTILLCGHSILNPYLWFTLWNIIKQCNFCILHTQDAHSALIGAIIRYFNKSILLVHSRRVSYTPSSGIRLWKYIQADAVVGVSREITENIVKAGVKASCAYTIHSGIAPETYIPKVSHEKTVPFTFLSVGALTHQKGFSILIDAASILAKEESLPSWRIRIVGDGPLMQSLKKQIEVSKLNTHVEMPGRREGRDELPHCDAVVVPSVDGEGSSATIKEAWVTGVPLIVSDLQSNRELALNEQNALITNAGDAESLAKAMRRILIEPSLVARLVKGGNISYPLYTDIKMAESYRLLYDCLIKKIQSTR